MLLYGQQAREAVPPPLNGCRAGIWTSYDDASESGVFEQVGGGEALLGSTQLVANASYYFKVYVAAAAALAELDLEESLLTDAATQGNMSFFSWMNYTLRANSTNLTQAAWELQQMINATCACIGVPADADGTLWGSVAYAMLNRSMDHFHQGANGTVFGANGSLPSPTKYQIDYCMPLLNSTVPNFHPIPEYNTYNITVNSTNNATTPVDGTSKFYGPVPSPLTPGISYITLYDQLEPSPNMTATCARVIYIQRQRVGRNDAASSAELHRRLALGRRPDDRQVRRSQRCHQPTPELHHRQPERALCSYLFRQLWHHRNRPAGSLGPNA